MLLLLFLLYEKINIPLLQQPITEIQESIELYSPDSIS